MSDPQGQPTTVALDKATELQLLVYDLGLIHRICQEIAPQRVIDVPTDDHGRYLSIIGDLWSRLLGYCKGVAVLLDSALFDSAVVVSRAAYEGGITLVYLMTVGDKFENARLFEARTVIEVLETYAAFPNDPGRVDAQSRIQKISAATLNEARNRKGKRRGWSGKTIGEMAKAINIEGHKAAYAIQSWAAHSSVGGWRADTVTDVDGVVRWQWGKPASQRNVEAVANHTRRTLHAVYGIFIKEMYGILPQLATVDPHKSNQQAIESPPDA